MAEWFLERQRYTLCGIPGQVCTERGDEQAQSPDGDLSGLETISEIHHCRNAEAEAEVGDRKLGYWMVGTEMRLGVWFWRLLVGGLSCRRQFSRA